MSHDTHSSKNARRALGIAREATDVEVGAACREEAVDTPLAAVPPPKGSRESTALAPRLWPSAPALAERPGAPGTLGGPIGAKPSADSRGEFRMMEDGLWFVPPGVADHECDLFTRVTETPFSYDALLADGRNARTLVLGYAGQDGEPVQIEVPRALLHDERRLFMHLEDHGLACTPLGDRNRGLLVRYLTTVAEPKQRCKLGDWRARAACASPCPSGEAFGAEPTADLSAPSAHPLGSPLRRGGRDRPRPKKRNNDDFRETDGPLLEEMKAIVGRSSMSATRAALRLIEADRVPGRGNPDSKATRLVGQYYKRWPELRRRRSRGG